jgi:DNA-binding transcriptional LysR family regulator
MPVAAAQILLLHEIAQRGSLASTAQSLLLTPSAVTQQVNRLERDLGATVVDRRTHGTQLTPLGKILAAEGPAILASLARAGEASDAYLRRHASRLRVAALASTVRPLVADALALVRLRFPDAELSVTEVGSEQGVDLVDAGLDVDVAVVADYGRLDIPPGVRRTALGGEPMLLVVPDGHPAAHGGEGPVDLGQFTGADWVSGAAGTRHRIQQDEVAARFGFSPRVPFETESYEVAESIVAAGVAVAVVPRSAWHGLPGTTALPISGNPRRELVAVTPAHTEHLALLPTLLDALRCTASEREMSG